MVQETWVQSLVASYQRLLKWYLIPPGLTLGNIKYVLRVKWSNPGKGVVSFPTPLCNSYWKGSLLVVNFTYYLLYWGIIHHFYLLFYLNDLHLICIMIWIFINFIKKRSAIFSLNALYIINLKYEKKNQWKNIPFFSYFTPD